MSRDVENRSLLPAALLHGLSLVLGAAALASSVLTFLEMKAAQPAPGPTPGADFLYRPEKAG